MTRVFLNNPPFSESLGTRGRSSSRIPMQLADDRARGPKMEMGHSRDGRPKMRQQKWFPEEQVWDRQLGSLSSENDSLLFGLVAFLSPYHPVVSRMFQR